jgi:hypothetical protein
MRPPLWQNKISLQNHYPSRRKVFMKKFTLEINKLATHIDSRTIQFALLVITLSLLAIGAGAPVGGGGGAPGVGG